MQKSVEFKDKALKVIDVLCQLEGHKNMNNNFVDLIYRIAHAASETFCEHKDWEEEVEDLYQKMSGDKLL